MRFSSLPAFSWRRARDAARTSIVTFTFLRGTIIYDGAEYRIERTTPA